MKRGTSCSRTKSKPRRASSRRARVHSNSGRYTGDGDGLGAPAILEADRVRRVGRKMPVLQRRLRKGNFRQGAGGLQTEKHAFWPGSPYGCAMVYALLAHGDYRESYALPLETAFCSTRKSAAARRSSPAKIPRAATRIKVGPQESIISVTSRQPRLGASQGIL